MLLSARVGRGLLISGTARTGFETVASPAEHTVATTTPSELADLADPDSEQEELL